MGFELVLKKIVYASMQSPHFILLSLRLASSLMRTARKAYIFDLDRDAFTGPLGGDFSFE